MDLGESALNAVLAWMANQRRQIERNTAKAVYWMQRRLLMRMEINGGGGRHLPGGIGRPNWVPTGFGMPTILRHMITVYGAEYTEWPRVYGPGF